MKKYIDVLRTLFSKHSKFEDFALFFDFLPRELHHSDNNIILMKDGSLICLFTIGSIDQDYLQESDFTQISHSISTLMFQLPVGVVMETYFTRFLGIVPEIRAVETGSSSFSMYVDKRKNFLEDYNKSFNTNIVISLHMSTLSDSKQLKEYLASNQIFKLNREKLMQRIKSFVDACEILSASFDRFAIQPLQEEDTFNFLYWLINHDCPPSNHFDNTPLYSQILADKVETYENYGRVNNEKFFKILSFSILPDAVFSNYLQKLNHFPFDFHVKFSIEVIDFSEIKQPVVLNRKILLSLVNSNFLRFSKQLNLYTEFINSVLDKTAVPVHFNLQVCVFADDQDSLNSNCKYVQNFFYEVGFKSYFESNLLPTAFLSILPGHSLYSFSGFYSLSTTVADFVNIYSPLPGDAEPVDFFMKVRSNDLFGFNSFSSAPYHTFVCGPSSSGKSFLVNKLLLSYMARNPQLFVIDTSSTYKALFQSFELFFPGKTNVVEFSNSTTEMKFNPFRRDSFFSDEEYFSYLENLFYLIIGPEKIDNSLKFQIRDKLKQFAREYQSYCEQSEGPAKPFDFLIPIFEELGMMEITNSLSLFKDGRRSQLLNTGEDTLSTRDIVYFNIEDIISLETDIPIIVYIIFQKIYRAVREKIKTGSERPTIIVLEEFHHYLSYPQMLYWIEKFIKMGRHSGIMLLFVIQDIRDIFLKQPDLANAIVTNVNKQIFLAGLPEVEKVFSRFKIQDHIRTHYMDLEKHEFLYNDASSGAIFLKSIVDPITFFLAMSDPVEKSFRERLIKEKGINGAFEAFIQIYQEHQSPHALFKYMQNPVMETQS